tara:strand:+ start:1597 stop:1746 length:150 start_codon:yes stop_codon:yes gene_type:complete
MINQDKQILNEWREFNKSAKKKSCSPELKRAIERADNIRLKIQREVNND